jgi:hypothetical protein
MSNERYYVSCGLQLGTCSLHSVRTHFDGIQQREYEYMIVRHLENPPKATNGDIWLGRGRK